MILIRKPVYDIDISRDIYYLRAFSWMINVSLHLHQRIATANHMISSLIKLVLWIFTNFCEKNTNTNNFFGKCPVIISFCFDCADCAMRPRTQKKASF